MSLLADVKGTMLGWIREGRYPPGSQLPSVPELVRRLEVSRTVVREALQSLAAMNLVEMKPGSGCYIRSVSPELISNADAMAPLLDLPTLIEVASARKAIEGAIARRAATTATDDDFDEIESILTRIEQIVDKDRPIYKIAYEFHVAVARSTHNKILESVVASFTALMTLAGELIEREHIGRSFRVEEYQVHRRMLNVLRTRDPELAQSEMEAHVERTVEHLRDICSRQQ